VWLVTVLAVQLGIDGAVSIAAISALIVTVLALRRLPASRLGKHAVKVTFVLGLAALFVGGFSTPPSAPLSASAAEWEWFDETAIAQYVASDKTVFVDVTADWCLTCQVNKKLVLDTAPVADWLDETNVIRMRADWTRPYPAISTYLARFGRYGIPFNVVYGPKAPQGIALPELLTDRIVMRAAYEAGVAPAQARK
ncbi:MAG: thioredoxin family protein, partial [Pseudomonadota bacterium]|nr:thioredoxin family protein [Pseudomonadota bacterium]